MKSSVFDESAPRPDGFFWCARCQHVVVLSQWQMDLAQNAPTGALVRLKCPRCHHREVGWKYPMPPRVKRKPAELVQMRSVSPERGVELFAQLRTLVRGR